MIHPLGKNLIRAFLIFCFITFSAPLLHAKILVVAPHPDDEIILASGIIAGAVERGEPVRIVYMTNGDHYTGVPRVADGYIRQGESVTAQAYLGVIEDQLLFLPNPYALTHQLTPRWNRRSRCKPPSPSSSFFTIL